MSAGVSPLSVAGASVLMGERSQAQRPGVAFEPSPQPVPSEPSGALNLPDEQAFKVSTINERLANLAAKSETARRLDLKA